MVVEDLDIEITNGETKSELTVTLKGESETVIQALINGLPPAALKDLHDAIAVELAKRKG